MEDEMESAMLPDSATHKLQNGETVSSRSSPEHDTAMPALSPQATAGNSFYGDQASKAEAISRAVLASSSGSLEGNFKNLIASFLRKMPDPDFKRGHMSDSEVADFQQRCVLGERKLNTDGNSGNSMNSDGSDELATQSRSYSANRSPCMEGRASDGKYSVGYGNGEQQTSSPFQSYLNPLRKMHKLGYDRDVQQDCDARFDSAAMKEFQTSSTSLEDNPLAAMLQKYAVVNGNDRFSMSPHKASGAIPGPGFPLTGLPKKRPFSEEMLHAPVFPQPSMQQGPAGLALNGYDGGADQSVFVCHACSFMARSDDEFQMHLKSHYDYYCQECGYHSRTKGRLDRHMKTFHGHAGDQTAVNPETSRDGSSPHNQNKANEPKTFKCRQCGFISYSREEHWSHNKIHIKVEKQLKCQFCSFVTEFKHHLEYHLRNHKGLKPFKCTKCNYSCVNKSMLNSHMKSHTNIYQFRCASCKYATKYSHSLKLHLINKKHVPAVVLNPDGSLPKDGSGNFELMSKRGPPRGPRGPRKVRQPSKSVSPPALMPVFPTSAAPVLPFSQGNEYSWVPSLGSQALGGQPMNGVAISASLPPMTMPMPNASVQSLAYPLSLLSQLSSTMMPSLGGSYYPMDRMDRMPGVAPVPIQCSFCHAPFSSPHLLAQHVKKEHLEKLNSFGVKLEARSPVHEASAAEEPDCYQPKRRNEMNPSDEARNYFPMSYTQPMISGDVTTSRYSKDHAKPDLPLNPQNIKRSNSEMESTERPLDLSSAKQSEDAIKPAVKIGAGEPDDLHNNISPSLAKGSAAASRKRSRKGKACKLDMISLTLQDNWEEEECPVEGSEASSFDSDCQPGHEGPHGNNEVDNGSWEWRKESPRPSDAADGDRPHSDARQMENNTKNGNASDQEPVSDSLNCSESISKGSDGFTSHVSSHSEKIVRESPGKEYNMCQHCGMGFRDIVTYSLHMGYHGYNDPFQCNMCGHRAEDPVGFFVHIARVAHE